MGFRVDLGYCCECKRGTTLLVYTETVDGGICEECIADCIDGSILEQRTKREFDERYAKES